MILLNLTLYPEIYSLTKLGNRSGGQVLPGGRFASVARLGDEVTVACELRYAPAGGTTMGSFRLLEIRGDFTLESIGVVAAVAGSLASAGVSLFAFSVWNTDAFLIAEVDASRAISALVEAGHTLTVV